MEAPAAASVRAEGEEDVVEVAGWELRFRLVELWGELVQRFEKTP